MPATDAGAATSPDFVLELRDIRKSFGAVTALGGVDLQLRRGEILGLVGDNGAGKSTLTKILSGAYLPDSGSILMDGVEVHIGDPRDAHRLGIEMVYQDLALFDNLDVASNLFVGRERLRWGDYLDKERMWQEAAEILARMGTNIKSPKLLVERMSGGQRQMIACARAVTFDSKVLLMDEPTAALGVREANALLEFIVRLKGAHSIILITQRIPDVLAIADRVMVMKGGLSQGVLEVRDVTLDDVVSLIVKGRSDDAAVQERMNLLTYG